MPHNLFGRSVQSAIIVGIFEKNFHWVSVVRGLYLGKLFTEITQPLKNTAFFSSCNISHVGLLVRELKKVNKQHLKFINRCNHLPQTHKKNAG